MKKYDLLNDINFNFFVCKRQIEAPWILISLEGGGDFPFGYERKQFVSKSKKGFSKWLHEDDFENLSNAIKKAVSEKVSYSLVYRILLKNGSYAAVHEQGNIVWNGNLPAHCECVLSILPDYIPTLPQKNENKYKTILDYTSEAILIHKNYITIEVNKTFCDMFGYSADQIVGKEVLSEIMARGNDPAIENLILQLKNSPENSYENIMWFKTKNGEKIFVTVKANTINLDGESVRCVVFRDISKEVHARQKLLDSNEKYRSLINGSSEGIFIHDNGVIVEVSPRFCEILGRKEEDLIDKSVTSLLISDEIPKNIQNWKENKLNFENNRNDTYKVYHSSGKVLDIKLWSNEIDLEGKQYRYIVIRDVTEEKEAQRKLEQSHSKYKRLSDITDEMIIVHDNGIIVEVNRAACELYNLTEAEMIGLHTFELLTPETIKQYQLTKNELEASYQSNIVSEGIFFTESNGKKQYLQYRESIFYVEGRKLRYDVMRDITAQNEAQLNLIESSNKYKLFADTTQEAISIHKGGILKEANKAFQELFHLNEEDVKSFNSLNIMLPKDKALAFEITDMIGRITAEIDYNQDLDIAQLRNFILHRLFQEMQTKGIEFPYYYNEFGKMVLPLIKSNGEGFIAEYYEDFLLMDGEIYQYQLLKDITKTVEAQRKLIESNRKYKFFAEATKEGIIIHKEGEILEVNEAACRLFDRIEGELIGLGIQDLVHNDADLIQLRNISQDNSSKLDRILFCKSNGEIFITELWESNIEIEGEHLRYTVIRDITERIRYEERIEELVNNLSEKNKQLNCLFDLAGLSNSNKKDTLDELMVSSLYIIPQGWQFPEICEVCLSLGNKEWKSEGFFDNLCKLQAPIIINDEEAGLIKVTYIEECQHADEGPFLVTERTLIDALGIQLGMLIEKKQSEDLIVASVLETEDRERTRMAKELHDNLGQILMAVSLNLESVKKEIGVLSARNQTKLANAVHYLGQAIQESRHLAHTLMPKAISDYGFVLAVQSLVERLGEDIGFQFYDNLNGERLASKIELALFRVTQEAITNILKHSGANIVTIQLMKYTDVIILTIEDNGIGFKTDESGDFFGVNSMRNRTHSVSGVFTIESKKGHGTTVMIEIPI